MPAPEYIALEGSPPQGQETSLPSFEMEEMNDALLSDLSKAPDPTLVELNEEEVEALVKRITSGFEQYASINADQRRKHLQHYRNWRSIPEKETKEFPFEGASNVVVPLTSQMTEKMVSRVQKGIFGNGRVSQFTALDPGVSQDDLDELNQWFDYELRETMEIQSFGVLVHRSVMLDGIDLVVPSYCHEEKTLRYYYEYEIEDGPVADQIRAILAELHKEYQVVAVDAKRKGLFEVDYLDENGEFRQSSVFFSVKDGRFVVACDMTRCVFDGVKLESLRFEDLVHPNSACDVDALPFLGYHEYLSVETYLRGIKDGEYIDHGPEETDRIARSGGSKSTSIVPRDISDLLDKAEGSPTTDEMGTSSEPAQRWLEVFRWEGRILYKGELLDVIARVTAQTRKLIKIERLDSVTKDGKRTPVKFDWMRVKGRFNSVSFAEWISHCQIMIDGIYNSRFDAGLLSNVPWGVYVPSAGIEATILKTAPGKLYPVKDINGIAFPKTQYSPAWSFNEEEHMMRLAQEQAGLGDVNSGSFVSKRVTASEFMGASTAIDLGTEVHVTDLITSWRKLFYRIFGLYQQHIQDGRVFMVAGLAGEREVRRLKRSIVNGRMDYQLVANVQQLSAQLDRDITTNMFSMMLNEILVDMGIVKPDTVYAGFKKLCDAYGYSGVPLHKPDMPAMSPAPSVEHHMFADGKPVQPSINENFNEHLQAHMMLLQDPKIEELLSPEAIAALTAHVQETGRVQQLVTLMRRQQAALAASANNRMAQQGINPTGIGGQQAGDQAGPATQEEGALTGPTETLQ